MPTSWTSGVYLAKLTSSRGNSSFIIFVVRDDSGTADIVVQISVNTYQAYNSRGGVSLYSNATNKSIYSYAHATKVSFDRPYEPGDSNGAGQYLFYEYPFVEWAEEQDFSISYVTDVDTGATPNPLLGHKAFVVLGHDEYWSMGMRTNIQNAVNTGGVNLAVFSGNTGDWQIRYEPDANGIANRTEVGYKDFATQTTAPGPDPDLGGRQCHRDHPLAR